MAEENDQKESPEVCKSHECKTVLWRRGYAFWNSSAMALYCKSCARRINKEAGAKLCKRVLKDRFKRELSPEDRFNAFLIALKGIEDQLGICLPRGQVNHSAIDFRSGMNPKTKTWNVWRFQYNAKAMAYLRTPGYNDTKSKEELKKKKN